MPVYQFCHTLNRTLSAILVNTALKVFRGKFWTQFLWTLTKIFPDSEQKTIRVLAKNYRRSCQNCILFVHRKLLKKFQVNKLLSFWLLLDFWEKFLGKVVKTAFYVSRGTFSGLEKISNVNMFTLNWQITEEKNHPLRGWFSFSNKLQWKIMMKRLTSESNQ